MLQTQIQAETSTRKKRRDAKQPPRPGLSVRQFVTAAVGLQALDP
jgi:hypothetical protein